MTVATAPRRGERRSQIAIPCLDTSAARASMRRGSKPPPAAPPPPSDRTEAAVLVLCALASVAGAERAREALLDAIRNVVPFVLRTAAERARPYAAIELGRDYCETFAHRTTDALVRERHAIASAAHALTLEHASPAVLHLTRAASHAVNVEPIADGWRSCVEELARAGLAAAANDDPCAMVTEQIADALAHAA